jgi:hypothetical protein
MLPYMRRTHAVSTRQKLEAHLHSALRHAAIEEGTKLPHSRRIPRKRLACMAQGFRLHREYFFVKRAPCEFS